MIVLSRCPHCRTRNPAPDHKCSLVRCPCCRTHRATFVAMLKHVAQTGHVLCDCGQGASMGAKLHHPHRPGTHGCEKQRVDDEGNPVKLYMPWHQCPF